MTITERDQIDIIATQPGGSEVRLVIADHLPWDDLPEHARLLQDKVNAYLAFIESGQWAQTSGIHLPERPEFGITLAVLYAPTGDAKAFLASVKNFLGGVGVAFTVDASRAA